MRRFEVCDRVVEPTYGHGNIVSVEDDYMRIEFDEHGTKKFLTSLAKLERSTEPGARKKKKKAVKQNKIDPAVNQTKLEQVEPVMPIRSATARRTQRGLARRYSAASTWVSHGRGGVALAIASVNCADNRNTKPSTPPRGPAPFRTLRPGLAVLPCFRALRSCVVWWWWCCAWCCWAPFAANSTQFVPAVNSEY